MNEMHEFKKRMLNLRGRLIELDQPAIMGVINITPDSFFAGSRTTGETAIIEQARKMLSEGAAMLDIGGHSTRPGAESVSELEEIERVVPAIESILKEFPHAILSIDTFRSSVAKQAITAGASMVNDISGGRFDPAIVDVAAHHKVPFILGHLQGDFRSMMKKTDYDDLLSEIIDYFTARIEQLKSKGINDIIIDPGFGFSKTLDQNFELLRNLGYFVNLEKPVMVGISRKSMIYRHLNSSPEEALNGTTVLHTIALSKGASILRVHDVKEAMEVVALVSKTYG